MTDRDFERNIERLLAGAQEPPRPSPGFGDGLRARLHERAARIRMAARSPAVDGSARLRRSPWMVAAAATIVVAVGGIGLTKLTGRGVDGKDAGARVNPRPPVVPRAPVGRLSVDRPVVMQVPAGAVSAFQVDWAGTPLASLELLDGAEVELRPGLVPELAVRRGVLRVLAARRLRVEAGTVGVDSGTGGNFEIEFTHQGDATMNKSWLVPGGLGGVAGAAIVLLVHSGDVRLGTPDSRPAPVTPEHPVVVELPSTRPLEADDSARRLAHAERRIAELEKKLAAAKKETDTLAAELVKKKGVTLDSIAARFAELRRGGGMAAFLPGKTADLIADLKGLGEAGTQAVLDLLKSDDPKDRFLAAKLLEDLKDPAAIPALLEVALTDEDTMAARMAGHALALMEDARAINPLRQILEKNRSWEDNVNALWGLVNLGDQRALEQATGFMNDKTMSDNARAALGANIAVFMHYPEVMPIVDATVRDFHDSERIMTIAIDYYNAVDSHVARERLRAIADDTRLSDAIREQARQALLN